MWEGDNLEIQISDIMEEIALDPIIDDFDSFIDDETNTRIILSGPFGIGKSYFLEKFFNEKKSDKYLPIIIRPINYAILQNEDIFKFIQYDILKEILSHEKFPYEDIEEEIKAQVNEGEIIKSALPTLFNLLKAIPKLGEFALAGEELYKFFKNIKEVKSKDSNAFDKLTDEVESHFLNAFEDTGSIINQYLKKLTENKGTHNSIKKVLIIDDLDRLDPDHIFRIFNVFSAFLDKQIWKENGKKESETIFGFDKVIISCDIENIKNIFHHKYGAETDFEGYIDKFYSKKVYSFYQSLEKVYSSLKNELSISFRPKDLNVNKELMPQLLTSLLYSGSLNLRFLENIKFNPVLDKLNYQQKATYKNANDEVNINKDDVFLSFEILLILFSNDKEIVGKKLDILLNYISKNPNFKHFKFINTQDKIYYVKRMLLYTDIDKHQFLTTPNREEQPINEITNDDFNIHYEITKNHETSNLDKFKITLKPQDQPIDAYLFYTLYNKSFRNCLKYNLL